MTTKFSRWVLVALVSGLAATWAQDKVYVIDAQDKKIPGTKIKVVDQIGTIELTLPAEAGKPALGRTFKSGSYKYAFTPEPDDVAQARELLEAGKFAEVSPALEKAFVNYRYLGWGATISEMRGQALLALKQPAEALQQFLAGERFAYRAEEKAMLSVGKAKALIAQDRAEDAKKVIAGLSSNNPKVAPSIYALKGYMLEFQGQKQEAVLEYLKVWLLYPEAGIERRRACERIVALLKELKDRRAADFQAELSKLPK